MLLSMLGFVACFLVLFWNDAKVIWTSLLVSVQLPEVPFQVWGIRKEWPPLMSLAVLPVKLATPWPNQGKSWLSSRWTTQVTSLTQRLIFKYHLHRVKDGGSISGNRDVSPNGWQATWNSRIETCQLAFATRCGACTEAQAGTLSLTILKWWCVPAVKNRRRTWNAVWT